MIYIDKEKLIAAVQNELILYEKPAIREGALSG